LLKIAVIGTGKMGQLHITSLQKLSKVELVGIVGRNEEQNQKLAEKYQVNAYTSLEELINEQSVDIIDICLPTYLHSKYIKLAASKGKHIICEKPLALSVEQCKSIIEECNKNNVQLFVGQTLRFSPEYVSAREQVLNGVIGNPGVVQLSRKVPYPQGKELWYQDEEKSGGIVLDLGIHDIDWLIWTFGDVERVMARKITKSNSKGTLLDVCFITLKMRSGTIAHIHLSWASPSFECSFELTGDNGMLAFNSTDTSPISLSLFENEEKTDDVVLPKHILIETPLELQFNHFIECIRNTSQPIVTPQEALLAVEIVEAIRKSLAENSPIDLVAKKAVL
jgi:predicted dehydrogenase